MPIANGYASLSDIAVRVGHRTDNAEVDSILESCVEAASRQIDQWTGRQFWSPTAANARYYTPDDPNLLRTADFVSLSSLKTDEDGDGVFERTWGATDYRKWPFNAAAESHPFTELHVNQERGLYTFPLNAYSVEVTAVWGWPSVPPVIKEATLMMAVRLYRTRATPYGVMESVEQQRLGRPDDDVRAMIRPYVRYVAVGA